MNLVTLNPKLKGKYNNKSVLSKSLMFGGTNKFTDNGNKLRSDINLIKLN